jgi:hypothetical protein
MTLEIIVEDMLITIRRLHNRVNKLPPELLSTIFESTNPTRIAFKISHVCQNWRETAIRCPRLWSKIKMSAGISLAHELCLERSGSVPLVVAIRVPWKIDNRISSTIPKNIQLLAPHHKRILSIALDAPEGSNFFYHHLNFSVPSLERFSCRRRLIDIDERGGDRVFPSSLFNGHTLSLKTIVFTNVPWADFGSFKNLTEIRISGDSYETLRKPDFSQVL